MVHNDQRRSPNQHGSITFCSLMILVFGMMMVPAIGQDQGAPPDVPPNWSVETLAEYPEIKHPTVVEVTPDGRVFVAEDPQDMMGPPGKPMGRILCFHPDGRKTVVADDLYAVFGLLYLDGKLYVNHPPKLTLFDIQGGKATEKTPLIERLGKDPWQWGFNDHIPSQLKLGMDGYIYMSVGDKGIHRAEGTDGSTATLHGGGILRFRPPARDLEVYATGTRNHLDIALTSQDEMFTYDNDGGANVYHTRVTHMVDSGYYGYPYEVNPTPPYVLPQVESYGGGSPTGAIAYTGARLPERFHDNLFMLEWAKGAVVRYVVSRSGATFQIDKRERLFTFNEDPFNSVGISQAEDGISFYVTDWNSAGYLANKKRGQFFKITYTGETRDVPIPDWYPEAGNGAVDVPVHQLIEEGLKHPAKRVRMVAQRRIADRGKNAVQPVVELLTSDRVPDHATWHGIWTLDAIDAGRSARDLIIDLTGDEHPNSVRRQAMRQLGTRRVEQSSEQLVEALEDENASIRFWAATALGRIANPETVPAMLNALDEDDRFTRFAVFTGLNRIGKAKPEAWDDIASGLMSSNRAIRTGTRFAMQDTYEVENVRALSNIVRNGSTRPARNTALRTMIPLMKKRPSWDGGWWDTSPADEKPRPRTEDWNGTDIVRSTLQHVVKSDNTSVKILMLSRLTSLPHHSILSALVETLLPLLEQPETRTAAVNALLNITDKKAIPAYVHALSSDNEQIRKRARKRLKSVAPEVDTVRKHVRGTLTDDMRLELARIYSAPEPIRTWHILGPFERDQTLPFDPGNFSVDQSFDGKNGTVRWTEANGNREHGLVNLQEVLGEIDHASAFARTTLMLDQDMKTRFILGSDDGLKVWVNGEQVFKDLGVRGWEAGEFTVPVSLKKGKNEIVCKIEQHTQGWRFSVEYLPYQRQWFEDHVNEE